MKFLLAVLCMIFFASYAANSDAVTVAWPTSDPSLPQIHMQVSIRNSSGDLIAYYEPKLWYISNVDELHLLLDTIPDKTIVYKDDQRFERIKFIKIFTVYDAGQITSEPLYYNGNTILHPRHDGIIAKPGYQIDVSWNFLRIR